MRVTSLFATATFKLLLEFDYREYRLLDIKQFLKNDKAKLAEIRDDVEMFKTAKLDRKAGTIVWKNGVDFDPEMLYQVSKRIGHILGMKVSEGMRDTDEYKFGYGEGFKNGFIKAVELVDTVSLDEEQRMLLAKECLDYLPFPRIIELLGLSVRQAEKILEQAEFEEYVKDKFDLYVEEDSFFDHDSLERIYQYRLKLAKGDIEDTPAQEIITDSKILSKNLKKLLIEYIEEKEKVESKDRGEI
nr:DUF2442 domain-containing protein [Heyndrickxia oleronia]